MATTTVLVTQTFEAWVVEQTKQVQKQVAVAIGLLAAKGLHLGYPNSSAIKGASIALRELRPAAGRSPVRVLYAFDPDRAAVVLCGGSKSDPGDMYEAAINAAEVEWAAHLKVVESQKAAPEQPTRKQKRKK